MKNAVELPLARPRYNSIGMLREWSCVGCFLLGSVLFACSAAAFGKAEMRTIRSMSSDSASLLVESAISEARKLDATICVVVLDEAGRFMAGRCMDGATNAAFEVASAKAKHSANFRRPTKYQEELLTEKGALQILAVPGMMPLEGGLPVQLDGENVGAIGVSGAASDVDGAIAAAAVASIGFAEV